MPEPKLLSPISTLPQNVARSIRYVFSDLDDTITSHGRLLPRTYQAICDLDSAGIKVIIVTGGPAGWCDCIARMWPVQAVVAEGGAFYMHKDFVTGRLKTREFVAPKDREKFIASLSSIADDVVKRFAGLTLSSDQFSRLFDLAIELDSLDSLDAANSAGTEPLKSREHRLGEVLHYLHSQGLSTKTSSIHINACLGHWDKLSSTQALVRELNGRELKDMLGESVFIGDSLNDDSMFGFFKHSVGVANVLNYEASLVHLPKWITPSERGDGFVEFVDRLLKI